MTPNKNRSRKYWVLMSIQFSDIYMLRKYIYIIHIYTHVIICIYIWLMLKILYYFGMLKNLWIFCDLCYCICLLFQNDPFFSSINRNFNWWILGWFLAQEQPRFPLILRSSDARFALAKWCEHLCVSRDMCVCVNLSTQHMYDVCIWYIYMCNLTDQEDLLDDDAHLSKDVDMHFPFQEGKDYGRRSSTFRWCERKDLKLSSPNSYSGSPSETHQIKWFHLDMVNLKLSQLWYSKHRKWWCKDFGKKGPAKTPWCLTQCVS